MSSLRKVVLKKKVVPDDVGVFVLLHLLEQGYFPQRGHGDALLRERDTHLLQRHHLTLVGRVPRLVHRSVST